MPIRVPGATHLRPFQYSAAFVSERVAQTCSTVHAMSRHLQRDLVTSSNEHRQIRGPSAASIAGTGTNSSPAMRPLSPRMQELAQPRAPPSGGARGYDGKESYGAGATDGRSGGSYTADPATAYKSAKYTSHAPASPYDSGPKSASYGTTATPPAGWPPNSYSSDKSSPHGEFCRADTHREIPKNAPACMSECNRCTAVQVYNTHALG